MEQYPIVPGRGQTSSEAIGQRLDFLKNRGHSLDALAKTSLDPEAIRRNIESAIGSVEIPLGLAGPLLFREADGSEELVFAPAGTLEGALLASMNRGAKAVSLSGGFRAAVLHQKMLRCPMFIFESLDECLIFKNWVDGHFENIKNEAEKHSNHAKLLEIRAIVAGRSVHLKCYFSTADAAGQNMTTLCTWHAVLFINDCFTKDCNIRARHFVIEGNGASDKKVSSFSMQNGRGVHVVAECELAGRVIEKTLRTTADDLLLCYQESLQIARLDGMVGYNINVANALAAIFVATGQDLGSLHESGLGLLNLEKTSDGSLFFSLTLPNLVVGTVGGGTHLPKQGEALSLMGCRGAGRLPRFAKLIAGFSLALEISTFAAIVGGQFAKSHEKLGRNKPVNWLTKSEITPAFLQNFRGGSFENRVVAEVSFPQGKIIENGVIIGLTSTVNRKLTGFLPLEIGFENGEKPVRALLKSKPTDEEVFQGLHRMAAHIDPVLADLLFEFRQHLEYKNCHRKELEIYAALQKSGFLKMPELFGVRADEGREFYGILQEWLDYQQLSVINSENQPELWTRPRIESALETIADAHRILEKNAPPGIPEFEPWKAAPLYHRFAEILKKEYADTPLSVFAERLSGIVDGLEAGHRAVSFRKTVVHNDFNPRNVAVRHFETFTKLQKFRKRGRAAVRQNETFTKLQKFRKRGRAAVRQNEEICVYDWELAVWDFPQRDFAEFLCFVLPENASDSEIEAWLDFIFSLENSGEESWLAWQNAFCFSLKSFLATRVSFYLVGRILLDFEFAERVFVNAFRLLDALRDVYETSKVS